ncbi:hypothetical protein L228DRAFT_258517 [Xylona heveae TC161]|uniref:Transcription factor IIIC 90kDa subunit N-terminal domain-containing protein n=1 Tax=Xylona heveae (strain CBS 132557 / TC161) TaxID=1328760 RepID=A0A165IKS2_XYLHT|nr:hypothetical protein L228DRAFT_258517 [Xylona heveae TC161]KZF25041.1 hypothetical protein L228DRAFT_258517 [Xylona heveae TC161]
MLLNIHLPFTPTDVDSVDWSKDGELAIAAGEYIQLLLPRYGSGTIGQTRPDPSRRETATTRPHETREGSDAQWDSLIFRANLFSEDEIPARAPAPFKVFSIGEEQGIGAVSTLKWSSPGIGLHRRPVLAVLTTNHLLSIWDGAARSRKAEHFNRVMILNDAVLGHFDQGQNGHDVPRELHNLNKLRRRIMSFAWSKPCFLKKNGEINALGATWGTSLFAVANDNNEMVILRIIPPSSRCTGGQWSTEALGDVRAQTLKEEESEFSLLKAAMISRSIISQIAWSPWVISLKTEDAILAYICGNTLRLRKVSVTSQDGQNNRMDLKINSSEFCFQPNQAWVTENSGPLAWYDKVHDGYLYLVASFGHLLSIISIPADMTGLGYNTHEGPENELLIEDIPGVSVFTYHILKYSHLELSGQKTLQPCWDEITATGDLIISFSTFLGHAESIRHVTSRKSNEQIETSVQPLPKSPWQRRIADCRAKFDTRHDLGGLSVVKVWGLSSSPGEDSIATLLSTHPGDMVEYEIASLEKSTAVFGSWEEVLQQSFLQVITPKISSLNCIEYSAEAFALQASRHLELYGAESVEPQSSFIHNVNEVKQYLDELSRTAAQSEPAVTIIPSHSSSPLMTQGAIANKLLYTRAITAQRYSNLLNMVASWIRERFQTQSASLGSIATNTSTLDDAQSQAILSELISTILIISRDDASGLHVDRLSSKLLYAASCAGLYSCRYTTPQLIQLCKDAFQWLSATHGVSLDHEISQCSHLQEIGGQTGSRFSATQNTERLDPGLGEGSVRFKGRTIDVALFDQSPGARSIFETCDMCGKGIPWEDPHYGRCEGGHIFVRCALTLLTIQAPGISKSCSICQTRYLRDDYLTRAASQSDQAFTHTVVIDPQLARPADQADNSEQAQSAQRGPEGVQGQREDVPSLITVLHSTCDICIYCGGKFMD